MNEKIRELLLGLINDNHYKPLKKEELALIFNIHPAEMPMFYNYLDELEEDGYIVKTKKGRIMSPNQMGLFVGKFVSHRKGYGFVESDEEFTQDLFIPADDINGALHNDRVMAEIVTPATEDRRAEGKIIKIIKREVTRVVGLFQENKSFGFVVPDDKKFNQDIFIPKRFFSGAKNDDKVVCEITVWPQENRKPEGKIIEVLGQKGERGVELDSIIRAHGLPEEFPKKVIDEANHVASQDLEDEIARRLDLRDLDIFTIDGEDAKDLDDAVSIERMDNGRYKLGVHIADVTHYVKEKNPLDKEALKRGTSVYLIDRVIPMLPKKLSNGICSLNPKVDRLALSCFMIIDDKGKVLNHEIAETVIRTSERMTYTDVTKILKDKDEELIKKYDYLVDDFKTMEELCLILREKRMRRGAIDFNFEESKIILNENGKPIDIRPYEREIANRIIEEFMLVCNETIAEAMFWNNIPFVYRVHEDPDEEKLDRFREFIYNLGYTMKPTQDIHPRMLQEVLEKVKGKKEEVVVSTLLLRSMMKAKYTPECTSHFGLAARYYCHFTSPIRRYPDLQIHRIIKEFLNGKIDEKRTEKLTTIVEIAAKMSSDTERIAEEAEREVDDLKKAEYMMDRIGEEFEGIISSVTSFGIFVELPNTVEGLVHITDLDDDYYVYDEQHLMLLGQRTKKIYRLGDSVKVVCSRVDIDNREIFFDILESENDRQEIIPSDETASIIAEVKKEFGVQETIDSEDEE